MTPTPTALVLDADRALAELLNEWLGTAGVAVAHADAVGKNACGQYDLAIVDIPYPRRGGAQRIADIAARHPAMPIIALSAAFFPCVFRCGAVAHELGVACVLPKPLSRDALLIAVRQVLR